LKLLVIEEERNPHLEPKLEARFTVVGSTLGARITPLFDLGRWSNGQYAIHTQIAKIRTLQQA